MWQKDGVELHASSQTGTRRGQCTDACTCVGPAPAVAGVCVLSPRQVTSYSLPLREIDTVQDGAEGGPDDGGYVPNALEVVVRKRHLGMLEVRRVGGGSGKGCGFVAGVCTHHLSKAVCGCLLAG